MILVLCLLNISITRKRKTTELDDLLVFEPAKITNSGQNAV